MANMPLDTSITVQPPVHGNRSVGPFANGGIGPLASRETGAVDQRPTSEFRPAKPFGVPDIPRNSALPLAPGGGPAAPGIGPNHAAAPGTAFGTALGAHVQDRARAALARAMSRNETAKNAIGSAVPSNAAAGSAMRTDRNFVNAAAVNGIGSSGTVVASRGDATGPNAGVTRNAVGITANFRPRLPRVDAGQNKIGVTATTHAMPTAPIINGRDLVARSGLGPGMIGGPARRSSAGTLSGSDFHLRHP
jgi:hypothetical protein